MLVIFYNFQFIGNFSLKLDEESFKKLNPPETVFDENYDKKVLMIINNGPRYVRELNPYEKMVNLAMIDIKENTPKFCFKAKSFYQKAVELSQNPKIAPMDKSNPIYLHFFNPKDFCYYNKDGI